ncbi:MAG: DUF4433 domain-containing protein [Propionibacteriaceae bacterium]|jgi:hypothetical protein|nr:DUF4433 domain-containing protein [Propionibacteriaceae bacterium]
MKPSTADDRQVFHFTHVDHLDGIIDSGLQCDLLIRGDGPLTMEAGHQTIKERRRRRVVTCSPGGVVADYVPFYFAPRSPMLYLITNPHQWSTGGVATFEGSARELIYLVTSIRRLMSEGCSLVLTDRNAVLGIAEFSTDHERWFTDGFIDWPLMKEKVWKNTAEYPDRKECRMAECLAYQSVPWRAIAEVVVRDEEVGRRVQRILDSHGEERFVPRVERDWYFK